MELKWTSKALSDLARLHEFLAAVNRRAAARAVQTLAAAPAKLLEHPRTGKKLEEFEPNEGELSYRDYQRFHRVEAGTGRMTTNLDVDLRELFVMPRVLLLRYKKPTAARRKRRWRSWISRGA